MRLLVATDLSARSDRALERAVMLARRGGLSLTVLHVVDDDLPAAEQERQRASAMEAIRDRLTHLGMPNATIEVPEGHAHQVILARAEDIGAGLIVVGAHRGRGVVDLFSGTTAERVIRAGQVPVLMVATAPTHDYARAVTGLDFSEHGVHAAGAAAALFPDCRQRLVHVYEVPFTGLRTGTDADDETRREHRERLDALIAEKLEATAGPFEVEVRRGVTADMLRKEVEATHADLVVVGTRGAGGALSMLGSVAHELLAAASCDVLVAHA